jgi:hypothetical protein
MRLADWEANLLAVLAHHASQPGAWGKSDCWMMTMEAVEAMTGEKVLPKLRGYKTEAAGYKLFAKHGFTTVQQALEAAFPAVPALMAHRGDSACVARPAGISCGIVTAAGIAVRTLHDDGSATIDYLPITAACAAFKV